MDESGRLPGLDGIGFALDQAERVRLAGLGGEIVHFIVQQETEPGRRDAAAVAAVERVGHGDCVAFRIDDVVVRGLGAFVSLRACRAAPARWAWRASGSMERRSSAM